MKKVLMKQLYYPIFSSVFIVMVLLLISSLNPSYAQEPVEELSGWFSIVWGDSENGEVEARSTHLAMQTVKKPLLQLDETVIENLGGVLKFNGKYVSAQGTLAAPSGAYMAIRFCPEIRRQVLKVTSISPAPLLEPQTLTIDGAYSAAASGAFPWVTIMCKFSDIADEPEDVAIILTECTAVQNPAWIITGWNSLLTRSMLAEAMLEEQAGIHLPNPEIVL